VSVSRRLASLSRIAALVAVLALGATSVAAARECVRPGAWAVPQQQGVSQIAARELLDQAATRSVVLLGEQHDRVDHHRWQLHTMAALYGRRVEMVLGFEMFPRRVQPVLDRWVNGELSEAQFLRQSEWARVWSFDAGLYLPLFHFARMHRIPMVALNVDRSLIREVARKGWEGVPERMREGVGRPAAAPAEYLSELHAVFGQHGDANKGLAMTDPGFLRFVDGQTTWDRAMAEAIRAAHQRYPGRQVVAVMGRGHTGAGGVPHQLRALGVSDAFVLLPWEQDLQCSQLKPGVADAVFGLEAASRTAVIAPPRLGVLLGTAEGGGVRIDRVSEGSIAAQSGLKAGDVLLTLAGRKVAELADVGAAVGRQAPGTWLPIRIRREGVEVEVVAKFPPAAP